MKHHSLSRPIKIHVCRDGTISYRTDGQPILNGRALPVFSVDTEEQAQALQVRFCRQQYESHPEQPDRPWYKLSVLRDGTDPVSRREPTLKLNDLDGITEMFQEFWEKLK